ncbi:hypothetical protein NFI96_006836 [Prochilodus magdalenae]|nr:hypothetical protein NFI96_006836 [Prochilodus magdalenae]
MVERWCEDGGAVVWSEDGGAVVWSEDGGAGVWSEDDGAVVWSEDGGAVVWCEDGGAVVERVESRHSAPAAPSEPPSTPTTQPQQPQLHISISGSSLELSEPLAAPVPELVPFDSDDTDDEDSPSPSSTLQSQASHSTISSSYGSEYSRLHGDSSACNPYLTDGKQVGFGLSALTSRGLPADGAVGVEVEGHQVFWTCDNRPFISVLTTVPPHTGSLAVSTKTKAGLVTEDDPLPF